MAPSADLGTWLAASRLLWQVVRHFEERDLSPLAARVEPVFLDTAANAHALGWGDGSFDDLIEFAQTADLITSSEALGGRLLATKVASGAAPASTAGSYRGDLSLASTNKVLAGVVKRLEDRDQVPLAAIVKPLLRDALGGVFDEREFGFSSFGEFLQQASADGVIRLEPLPSDLAVHSIPTDLADGGAADPRPTDPREPNSAVELTGAPAYRADQVLAFELLAREVTRLQRDSANTSAGGLKNILQRANRSFNEQRLGFRTFGEFLDAAEEAGYVELRHRPGHGRTVVDVYTVAPGLGFSDIQFGYSSASAESIRDPRLLLEGFYDPRGIAERLRNGPEFLVLGYKGSGKSSIGEHLNLVKSDDPSLFVDLIDLRDFPVETLASIAGEGESLQLLQVSWRWLLLVRIFQSILQDAGANSSDQMDAQKLARGMEKAGLIAGKSMRSLSLKTAEVTVNGGLGPLIGASVTVGAERKRVSIDAANAIVLEQISRYRTNSTHLIVIDGVDELISVDPEAFGPISSLLSQVDEINSALSKASSTVKIVMMCRSDLYERVPSPNKNKLRQDFAISLRWHDEHAEDDEESGGDAELLRLILQRAHLSGYTGDNPLGDLLPRSLLIEGARRIRVVPFLLEHTRRTPRDLVSLLAAIQRTSRNPPIRQSTILKGLDLYSSDYFLPELKDELAGYLVPSEIEDLFGLLASIGSRVFSTAHFERLAQQRGLAATSLLQGLQILFECSALGQERSSRGEGKDHRYRYQYPNLSVNPDLPFIIHRGAWRALSLDDAWSATT